MAKLVDTTNSKRGFIGWPIYRQYFLKTENPCLGHYSKDKENLVTTDASKTGLGITLWQKQDNGDIKSIALGSTFLKVTEKNYSIRELELSAVFWRLDNFLFSLYGKKVHLYTDQHALEPLKKETEETT